MKINILAIIPAKSNSSGLQGKNLKKLNQKYLFEYPIAAALGSKYIKKNVAVTSDSTKILNLSEKLGVRFICKRSKKLSNKNSKISDVICHLLKKINYEKYGFNALILLEPTSPLTNAKIIDFAIKKYIQNYPNLKSFVSLGLNEKFNVNNLLKLKGNKILPLYNQKLENDTLRQKYQKNYFMDGSFYISEINFFIKHKGFLSNKTGGIVLKKKYNFEIDDELDFKIFKNVLI
tara:strand:+ start:1327 stop:2025 length:699 start_codon:yes stop_codon:yes gene_type:complete